MERNQIGKLNTTLISITMFTGFLLATACQPEDDLSSRSPENIPETNVPESFSEASKQADSPTPVPAGVTETPTEAGRRGQLAKLSPEQIQQLFELESVSLRQKIEGLGTIVPAYIPEDFSVYDFHAADKTYHQNSTDGGSYTYYSIRYQSFDQKSCFSISHAANDGDFGDGPVGVETIEDINVPSLSINADIGYITFDQEASSQSIVVNMQGEGLQFYTLISPTLDETSLANCNSNISLNEFIKIVESLQHLDSSLTRKLAVRNNVVKGGPYYNPFSETPQF